MSLSGWCAKHSQYAHDCTDCKAKVAPPAALVERATPGTIRCKSCGCQKWEHEPPIVATAWGTISQACICGSCTAFVAEPPAVADLATPEPCGDCGLPILDWHEFSVVCPSDGPSYKVHRRCGKLGTAHGRKVSHERNAPGRTDEPRGTAASASDDEGSRNARDGQGDRDQQRDDQSDGAWARDGRIDAAGGPKLVDETRLAVARTGRETS